ncbi:MAG: tagaturonate reductase, partial [Oscillospiraceae bacterium]|nr:tagaturonate reductase [Oscillospiraceae bacterium]
MQQLNRNHPLIESAQVFPEKVLMFGESAFLCALVCPALDELNRKGLFGGSVTVAGKNIEHFKTQEGLFTIIEKGIENGGKSIKTNLIICVTDYINPYSDHDNYIKRGRNPELRFIVSDAPDAEKIAALLYERFAFFKGDEKKGLILFSCGRVENNGAELKANVQKYADERGLGKEFKQWMENVCFFANTTADRIVTGFPREDADRIQRKLGYHDELLTICELFYFWAIEAPITVKEELPLDKAGFNIIFNDDITPHHLRKTRLLNGALTCLAPAALLHGYKTVDEAMGNINFKKYLEKALFKEIIPTLDINRNVLDGFAKTVIERLSNPLL